MGGAVWLKKDGAGDTHECIASGVPFIIARKGKMRRRAVHHRILLRSKKPFYCPDCKLSSLCIIGGESVSEIRA